MIKGIDVSRYQSHGPNTDPANLPGVSFYIAKATEGLALDSEYNAHIRNARVAGIPIIGAYHFGRKGSGVNQAKHFLAVAGNVDCYALDIEGNDTLSETEAKAFISYMHSKGKLVGMYHSESGFPKWGQDWDWVANYSQEPNRHYDIWQYGPFVPNVDGNQHNGSVETLKKVLGVPVRTFDITDVAKSGTITVSTTGHYYLDLATDHLRGPIVPPWVKHPAFGPIVLNDTIDHKPGNIARKTGYLIGVGAAFVLATDCTFVPDQPDCKAEIAAAISADRKKAHVVVSYE